MIGSIFVNSLDTGGAEFRLDGALSVVQVKAVVKHLGLRARAQAPQMLYHRLHFGVRLLSFPVA
jgi:hypothetical protein